MEAGLLPSDLWDGRFFSSGWRPGNTRSTLTGPGADAPFGTVGIPSKDEINEACARAASAQQDWASWSYGARAAVIRRAAALAERHRAEMAASLVNESGSIQNKADYEVDVSIRCIHAAAALPIQPQGLMLPSDTGRLSIARRRPRGVIGIIAPFNFPLYLAIRTLAPALALGNAVVLKPDLRTAVCGGFYLARLFEQAGLPPGVLHVLPGGAEIGQQLCDDPHVDMIQFTGSTDAGRAVGRSASGNLKKVSLELGGNNTLIVLDDADIDRAASNAAFGAFLHQGQICMATGRVLVQSSIAATFIEKLVERTQRLQVGAANSPESALGPLISEAQVKAVKDVVDRSVAQGARVLAGGTPDGLLFPATLVTDVKSDMSVFREEAFGPVVGITTFDTDDEAIELANASEYGLAAGIITTSIKRAMQISERLKVGHIHINDQTNNEDANNPFGGVGHSGNGSSIGGPANWEELTRWQWVTMRDEPVMYAF
ncbi:benzaldehyde dehydrogenase [Burkholderia sp. 3C]